MEGCGQSYGLHQVAYDTLLEVMGDTGYWWSRMSPAFPHMCAPEPLSRYCWSYDRSFRAEPCSGVRSLIAAYSSDDALDQHDWAWGELYPMLCEDA